MSYYVTLEEAKDHCRVDYTDDDIYINDLIKVAQASVLEEIKGRYKCAGTVTTAASTALVGDDTTFLDYKVGDTIRVETETDRVIATITDDKNLTVTLAFTTSDSGLTFKVEPSPLVSSALPKPIKQAILMMIGHLYNMSEPVVPGVSVSKVPYTLEYLLAPYKDWVIA
jgi:hypothetical protein